MELVDTAEHSIFVKALLTGPPSQRLIKMALAFIVGGIFPCSNG